MACYEAALAVDANNPLAANELGVMLAKYGRYEAAQALLERSTALYPHPAAWRNLAVIYQNTGQHDAARNALAQGNGAARPPAAYQSAVQWMSNQEFAGTTPPGERINVQGEIRGATQGDSKPIRPSASTLPRSGIRR